MSRCGPVLVVDDDPALLALLGEIIRSWDFDVILCDSGAEALAQLRTSPLPSLLLVDVVMPGIDGSALARQVQAHPEWGTIPLVFVSGLTDPPPLPHVAFLRKPVLMGALHTLVYTYCVSPTASELVASVLPGRECVPVV